MKFQIKQMTKEIAVEVLNWNYDKPYDFYNNELTNEAIDEMLRFKYYSVYDSNGNLYGFFCIGEAALVPVGEEFGAYKENYVDMGLGMKPNLTGQGNGFPFCTFIIKFIEKQYIDMPIRLTVATFNERAIRLYERLGFKKDAEFSTPKGITFQTMIKKIPLA